MKRFVIIGLVTSALLMGFAGVAFLTVMYTFGRGLPDIQQLADYEPAVTTRLYAADGRLLAEFAKERRLFVPVSAIPTQVVNAFLAAEDQHFYQHEGLDFIGIARAVLTNLRNYATDQRLVGASTITQQVAKNFLLSGEVSYERKVREAILAYRIEQAFTKDQILELYLNEIYLGSGTYGVAAASLYYFDKSLNELNLAETAYLAALPKAPNNYHPIRKYSAAISRRNWVLGRMRNEGFISRAVAKATQALPLEIHRGNAKEIFNANYFNEEVRRQLYNIYGENALYEGGLSVRTSLDPKLQDIAERTIQQGLINYDRRHGWRGAIAKIDLGRGTGDTSGSDNAITALDWRNALNALALDVPVERWRLAVVWRATDDKASIVLSDGTLGILAIKALRWARQPLKNQARGPSPQTISEVVVSGDVIYVEALDENEWGADSFGLRQKPNVEGALVAMDPHTGRVLAMVGGFDFAVSEFNRATQAKRQPGSAFKPFVYAAALEQGFTPSDLILDAPFVIDQGYGLGKWKPANYTNKFYGPSTLRLGIEKSRNLMTVRLAQNIGMDKVSEIAGRFGIIDNMPETLAMSLGAGETTLMRLTAAYSILVNGGKKVLPTLIDRIQDRRGKTVYRTDNRDCVDCIGQVWEGQEEPVISDTRAKILDSGTAYQMVSFLEGVVQRGTGVRIRAVGKPLAGKTGTTNNSQDTWFIGFSPDLALGIFVGFDSPRSLGKKETGSSVAAPMFRDFMKEALADHPGTPFRIPSGIKLVRVNSKTGLPTSPSDKNVILEAFKPGTEPTGQRAILDGSHRMVQSDGETSAGTGGLY